MKIDFKIILKNGAVINETMEFEDAEIPTFNILLNTLKEGLKENNNFQFTVGFTIIRGSDISAITYKQLEQVLG